MQEEIFHIAICTDEKYERYAIALAHQLHVRSENQSRYQLIIHALTIKGFRAEKLSNYCEKIGLKLFVHEYDAENFTREFSGAGHISSAAYLKIFIGSLLPIEITKCIFMDLDIYIAKDPLELLQYRSPHAISAVTHNDKWTHHPAFLKVNRNFNSGLLAINLEAWRKIDLTSKFLASHLKYGSLPYLDNDLMVLSLFEFEITWEHLPSKYNLLLNCHECRVELGDDDPVIVHFAGAAKPWNAPYGGIFARKYRKELREVFPEFRISPRQYYRYFETLGTNLIYRFTVKQIISLRKTFLSLRKDCASR